MQVNIINRARAKMESWFTSELFDYKTLRGMFLTLALDQFFILFLNVLTTSLVSSTGEAAIAAVSMVNVINSMVNFMFSSLALGGAIIVARAKGSGDNAMVRKAIGGTMAVTVLASIGLNLLLYVCADPLTNFLYPDAEPLLIEYAVEYMHLIALSFIPFAVFVVIFNAYRSLGDTKSSLMLTIVINGTVFIASLIFINGMHLGVTGAGLSYITARIAGLIIALVWQLWVKNDYGVKVRDFFHCSRDLFREICSLGLPIGLENMLLQGGMLLVQVYLAKLTTTDLAAHAVSNSIMTLAYSTGFGVQALAATVCGQSYGAKKYDLLKAYCIRFVNACHVVELVTVLILAPFLPLLMQLYHATEAGRPIIFTCLAIGGAAVPLFWGDSYVTPQALRAAGDSIYTTVVSVLSLAIGRCVIGYILTIPLGLGVPGVWLGMAIEWLIRGAILRIRFRGTKWLHV